MKENREKWPKYYKYYHNRSDIDINEKCNNYKLPFAIESKIPGKTNLVNILRIKTSVNIRKSYKGDTKINGKRVE